jgi:hypothetical protein
MDGRPSVPFRKFASKLPRSLAGLGQMWVGSIKESERGASGKCGGTVAGL